MYRLKNTLSLRGSINLGLLDSPKRYLWNFFRKKPILRCYILIQQMRKAR